MHKIFDKFFHNVVDEYIDSNTSTLSPDAAQELHDLLTTKTVITIEPPNENSY